MAPMESSPSSPEDDYFPIEEIVFSCSVCQATVSEVYATVESNNGFHSGYGDEDGIVTKMWIGECSHVTCARHLDNGAAPFHPKDKPPRAPCPKCMKDLGDDRPKDLYRIHGLSKGAYDPVIPDVWLQCPAVKLDTTIPGMEAVRFQYMALGHFARQVRKHWKNAVIKQSTMESAYSKERKTRRQAQSELLELKDRIEALEKCEAKLNRWENRKPEINHYMHAFGQLAKDSESMRQQLVQLGYDIPKREYTFKSKHDATSQPQHEIQPPTTHHNARIDSRALAANITEAGSSSSARKRKHDEYAETGFERGRTQQQEYRGSSRDLMPPPLPKPKLPQRGLSSYEEQLAGHTVRPVPDSRQSVQLYEGRAWREASAGPIVQRQDVRPHATPTQNRLQVQNNLPMRSSPTQHDLQQDFLQHPRLEISRSQEHYAPREATAQSAYDAYSFAQLSLQSPRRPRNQYDKPTLDHAFAGNGYRTAARNDQAGDVMHYSSAYGDGEQQQYYEARPRHESVPKLDHYRQGTSALGRQNFCAPPALQGTPQAPAVSVTSPFFKRNSRRPTMPRPLMRGSNARRQHAIHNRDSMTGYQMASTNPRASQVLGEPKSVNGLLSNQKPRHTYDQRAQYQSALNRPGTLNELQQPFAVPQTPRNGQGLFQRQDRPALSASYGTSRPQSNIYHNRVSIPPTIGRQMLTTANQDEALSQIRGVRGVSSQAGFPKSQRTGPGYGASTPLFASVGVRRSVRR